LVVCSFFFSVVWEGFLGGWGGVNLPPLKGGWGPTPPVGGWFPPLWFFFKIFSLFFGGGGPWWGVFEKCVVWGGGGLGVFQTPFWGGGWFWVLTFLGEKLFFFFYLGSQGCKKTKNKTGGGLGLWSPFGVSFFFPLTGTFHGTFSFCFLAVGGGGGGPHLFFPNPKQHNPQNPPLVSTPPFLKGVSRWPITTKTFFPKPTFFLKKNNQKNPFKKKTVFPKTKQKSFFVFFPPGATLFLGGFFFFFYPHFPPP